MRMILLALTLTGAVFGSPAFTPSWTDVSSTGGQFSMPGLNVDINPWDIEADESTTQFIVGQLQMPMQGGPLSTPVFIGTLNVDAWGYQDLSINLYAQVFSVNSLVAVTLQMDGITDNGNEHGVNSLAWVEFHYPSPIVGAPGSMQNIWLQTRVVDVVPEPGTWLLCSIGIVLFFIRPRK